MATTMKSRRISKMLAATISTTAAKRVFKAKVEALKAKQLKLGEELVEAKVDTDIQKAIGDLNKLLSDRGKSQIYSYADRIKVVLHQVDGVTAIQREYRRDTEIGELLDSLNLRTDIHQIRCPGYFVLTRYENRLSVDAENLPKPMVKKVAKYLNEAYELRESIADFYRDCYQICVGCGTNRKLKDTSPALFEVYEEIEPQPPSGTALIPVQTVNNVNDMLKKVA